MTDARFFRLYASNNDSTYCRVAGNEHHGWKYISVRYDDAVNVIADAGVSWFEPPEFKVSTDHPKY